MSYVYHFHDVCIPLCFQQTHRSPLNIRTSEGVRVVNLKMWTVRRRLQEWCWPKTELASSTSICIIEPHQLDSWPVEPRIVSDSLLGPPYGRVKYVEKERLAICAMQLISPRDRLVKSTWVCRAERTVTLVHRLSRVASSRAYVFLALQQTRPSLFLAQLPPSLSLSLSLTFFFNGGARPSHSPFLGVFGTGRAPRSLRVRVVEESARRVLTPREREREFMSCRLWVRSGRDIPL